MRMRDAIAGKKPHLTGTSLPLTVGQMRLRLLNISTPGWYKNNEKIRPEYSFIQ